MKGIDLNADLGEGGTADEQLLEWASSCNIACGGHAGSDAIMRRTVALAMQAGVKIGAHPGYEDPKHFGRRELGLAAEQMEDLVFRQVSALEGIVRDAGGTLQHVKPHGGLYHEANRDAKLAAAVVRGVVRAAGRVKLYAPPGGALEAAAAAGGMEVVKEGFADRRYRADGSLVPRGVAGAVIEEPEEAVAQALELVRGGEIRTLCVHGDGAGALRILEAVRRALEGL